MFGACWSDVAGPVGCFGLNNSEFEANQPALHSLHFTSSDSKSDLVCVAMAVGKKGFSKEDELLLQDFSKNVSTKVIITKFGFVRFCNQLN